MQNEIRFGKRLKLCRETLSPKKTQEEIANDLDIGRPYLSDLERDVKQPSYELLVKIVDYYGTSFDFLFGHQKKVAPLANLMVREQGEMYASSTTNELLEIIENMSERKKRIALAVLRAIDEQD